MCKGQLGRSIAQAGRQLGELTHKTMLRRIQFRQQAGFLPPMGEPLEELRAGQKEIARAGFFPEQAGSPLHELPIRGGKLFFFCRTFRNQLGQLRERFLARTFGGLDIKLNLQQVQAGIGIFRFGRGHCGHGGQLRSGFLGLGRLLCFRGGCRIGKPFGQLLGWRAVAQEIKGVAPKHQRRAAGEKHGVLHRYLEAFGQGQLAWASAFGFGELGQLAEELVMGFGHGRLQAGFIAPMREPLQELLAGEEEIAFAGIGGEIFGYPLNEFPVVGREQFLLMRGTHGEVHEIRQ